MQDSQMVFEFLTKGTTEMLSALSGIEGALKKLQAATGALNSQTATANSTTNKASAIQKSLGSAALSTSVSQETLVKSTNKVTNSTNQAAKAHENYMFHIAKTTVLSALVNKGFMAMVDSMGKAIQQVDLIKNFPATMGALGLSTQDASASLLKLRDYVATIGGDLAEATMSVTRFTEVTKNIKVATAEFVGVKNAIIAGGAGAEVQKNALEQLTQSYSRGKPQLIEWRSMMVAMPAQLNQVAKAMNFSNAQTLGEALTNNDVSMQDFMTELTKLSTGTGPIAQQAIARMQGIQFASNVMKNALTNGLAAIYQAVGRENIITFLNFLTGVIRTLASWVVVLINDFIKLFNLLSSIVGGPQISNIAGDAQGVADSLGAGADAAGDLGDNLDNAGGSADKLNKSLASFDKMNVLADKTSGSGGKDKGAGGGAGGISPADASALNGIFDSIGGKLKEVSGWAKAFAGILAGLVGLKFAQGIISQIDGVAKSFQTAKKGTSALSTALQKIPGGTPIFVGIPKALGGVLKSMKVSIITWSTLVLEPFIGSIGTAISGVFTAIAVALGVSVGWAVVIVVVAVLAIIAAIWLIWTNWDTIVKWMKEAWSSLSDFFSPAIESFKKIFEEIKSAVLGVWNALVSSLKTQWSELFGSLGGNISTFNDVWERFTGRLTVAWNQFYDAIKPSIKKIMVVLEPLIEKIKEFYNDNIKPLIDKLTNWYNINDGLKKVLNALGIVLAIFILAPLALIVGIVGLVVGWFMALAIAVLWVTSKLIEFGNYIIGGGLWQDIQDAVTATGDWIKSKFKEAWDFVVGIWDTLVAFFQGVWDGIVTIFIIVNTWFRDRFTEAWNGIVSVFTPAAVWFRTNVWDKIVAVFNVVGTWFRDRFTEALNGIVSIFAPVSEWFRTNVWYKIVNVFSVIDIWFRNTFQGAWNNITSVFSGAGEWFRINVIDRIVNAFYGIKERITGFFSGVWDGLAKGLKDALNNLLRLPLTIPSVTIAGKTIGGQTLIPRLARGGVIQQATMAMLGEAGAEAVVPLENNTEWIDKLAAKINASGGSGQPIQLTVQIGEERIASKLIDLINEKTQMSGRNMILV